MSDTFYFVFFFFQAEDGIRDYKVTGVQTCALPISPARPDVQHSLPRPNRRQASRRAAPVRHAQHFLRDEGTEVVEVVAGRATHLLAGGHGPGVPLADLLRDRLVGHESTSRKLSYEDGSIYQPLLIESILA